MSHIDAIQRLDHYSLKVTSVCRRNVEGSDATEMWTKDCSEILAQSRDQRGLVWTWQRTFGFCKAREISWLAEELLVSQGLCFVEMVTYDVVRTEVLCNIPIGFIWLGIGTSGWLLLNFGFHKMRGKDLLARHLALNTRGIQCQLLKIGKFTYTWKFSKTATRKWHLMFTRRWASRSRSSGIWRRVVQYMGSSVSGKPVANFRCSGLPRNVITTQRYIPEGWHPFIHTLWSKLRETSISVVGKQRSGIACVQIA